MVRAMEADSGIPLASLKVDGGASANNFLMQTQADMVQVPVKRPQLSLIHIYSDLKPCGTAENRRGRGSHKRHGIQG